jgi:hypothetical protein
MRDSDANRPARNRRLDLECKNLKRPYELFQSFVLSLV